jgi:hypothetical protein
MTQDIFVPGGYLSQQTISYKTFLKWSIVQSLLQVFNNHPDPILQTRYDANHNVIGGTNITVEYPFEEKSYPCVIVKFSERAVQMAGVGHIEYIQDPNGVTFQPYRHIYYSGTAEFVVMGLTSTDRDLVTDSLVQILLTPEMANYTNYYFNQIFNTEGDVANLNYLNLDKDTITGIGETVGPVPWNSENRLQYQAGYRTKIFGEFYSLPQNYVWPGFIENIEVYPYTTDDPLPAGIPGPSALPPVLWPV